MRYPKLYLSAISFTLLSVCSAHAQAKNDAINDETNQVRNQQTQQVQETPQSTQENATSTANSDETDNNTFGDWKITCPDQAPCRMAQSIVTAGDKKVIMQMRVFKGKDGTKDTALFSFPLGILLNTGWQIKIDNGKTQLLPFEICKEDGCHSGINIPNSLLNAMKRGNILKVKFFDASQKAIEPKISLKGFTKAYGELK